MQKYILILLAIIGVLVLGGTAYTIKSRQPAPAASITPSSSIISPQTSTTVSDSLPITSSTPETATTVYYPMTRYTERITNRWYDKQITAADRDPLPCGYPFTGYHTGDDLEVFPEELTTKTPVYAIAAGTVQSVGTLNGYGGLIVITHVIDGQTVTAYYGHINTSNTTIKEGDKVTAGQRITDLGDNCSTQTDGERKHLHFAIHNGSAIDVRGYADSQQEIAAWINPKEFLARHNAKMPQ